MNDFWRGWLTGLLAAIFGMALATCARAEDFRVEMPAPVEQADGC